MVTLQTLPVRVLRKLNHHRTTECYFVGFPKTGNTWLRYMLGRYVQLTCGLAEMPLFDATDFWGRCERFCVGPAMQFTHRPLLWRDQRAEDLDHAAVIRPFRHKRVVLLVRHPLDTLVSLWMQRQHRGDGNYSGSLVEMLDDPVWGIEKFLRFYTLWFQHRDEVGGVRLVRYEDMRADPHSMFAGILDYLAIPRRDDALLQAVADADFDSMRKVEQSASIPKYRSSGFSIFGSEGATNAEALHVRRGKVGGYADYIGPGDAERLLTLIGERLPTYFGYSVDAMRAIR